MANRRWVIWIFALCLAMPTECDDVIADQKPVKGNSTKLPHFLSKGLVDLFEPGKHSVTDASGKVRVFEYQLFKPEAAVKGEKFPLIVWLHGHGAGELNHRNIGQLRHLETTIFKDTTQRGKYPFYLLALQCPKRQGIWFPDQKKSPPQPNPGDVVIEVLDKLCEKHAINRDRISLVGISAGGNACWEIVKKYPGRFSAIVPLSSSPSQAVSDVNCYLDTSIWAFNCKDDPGVSIDSIRHLVTTIQNKGGTAFLSLIPSNGHDSWEPAFKHWNLLNWLLLQQRGVESPVEFVETPFAYTSTGLLLRQAQVNKVPFFCALLGITLLVAIAYFFKREITKRQSLLAGHGESLLRTNRSRPVLRLRVLAMAIGALTVGMIVFTVIWYLSLPSITIVQ